MFNKRDRDTHGNEQEEDRRSRVQVAFLQRSTSSWASPIVIIVTINRVDIRLCIEYRMVNELTRLMVYPMPLVNEFMGDLDNTLWY